MFKQLICLSCANLWMLLRDRILHAVLGVAAVMLLLVPSLSAFSMRQVQELAITLSLSSISLVLLVLSLLLGASAVWRDVERRYTSSTLTLPVSRAIYLLAKFTSSGVFIIVCGAVLGSAATVVIAVASTQYPSDLPIAWGNIMLAIGADLLKYLLLTAFAVLLSAVSTSFFLPFFGTLAIYLAGSASQEVFEYVTGQFGQHMHPLQVAAIKSVYYLLPNFAAFNFKVHAVYALPVSAKAVLFPLLYSVTYGGILLGVAIWAFNRRELP
jgi:ABC-type transport system involved in multi-copper enzyme maturation permease subunit